MALWSRRRFLERTALATGAVLAGRSSLAAAESATSIDRFNAGLVARTQPPRERFARVAAFITRVHPRSREQIIAAAEEAMRGELLLPGNRELSFVGNPPDWFTPRYGDEEYLWSLNRRMHWKTLVQAHALTGDARYPAKVVAELEDWIRRAQPPPFRHADGSPHPEVVTNSGPPAWRSLEMGMRMFDSWPFVLEALAGSEFLPPERLAHVARSLAQHAEGLALLTPLLWPDADHNHYFMEMLGLLSVGAYAPELEGAAEWVDQAMRELQRCVERQFTADGGHVEGCPSYHNICVVLLARYVTLAELCRRQLPDTVNRVLALAPDHVVHSVRPTGDIVPWGDSTRNNQVEAAVWVAKASGDVSVLADLAKLMGDARVQEDAAAHLWEIDGPEKLFSALKQRGLARALVRFDRGNDQVMMRSSWQRDAASVYFACHAPLTSGSGHQHVDLGGFDFTALGRNVVADPGVFTYRESEERRRFKSAIYHSVMTIDEREPFEYLNRWRYSPQREGRVSSVTRDAVRNHVRIDSFHRNYEPVLCRRAVVLGGNRWLAVIDVIEGATAATTAQIYFHLDSTRVRWDAKRRVIHTEDDDVRLRLAVSEGVACSLLPGEVSEKFDTSRPSTRVKFYDTGGTERRVFLSVLVPYRAGEAAPVVEDVTIDDDQQTCSFTLDGVTHRLTCSA